MKNENKDGVNKGIMKSLTEELYGYEINNEMKNENGNRKCCINKLWDWVNKD
jgi:hypothetical protein